MDPLYPSPSNITTITDLFVYVNSDLTNGVIGWGLMLIMFSITFINLKMNGFETIVSLRAGAFVTALVGILGFVLGLVGNEPIAIIIAINIILLFADYKRQ